MSGFPTGYKKIGRKSHVCQLEEDPFQNPVLQCYPGTSCSRSLKRWFVRQVILDDTHPNSEIFKASRKMLYDHKLENMALLSESFRIHPFSKFRKIWEIFYLIVSAPALFYFPLRWVSTKHPNLLSTDLELFRQRSILLLICDVVGWTDMILSCYTGVCDTFRDIYLDRSTIKENYLRTYFIPDLLSSAPVYYIFFGKHIEGTYLVLFRFLKVLKLVKYINNTNEVLKISPARNRMIIFLTIFILLLIWTTSLAVLTFTMYGELYYLTFLNVSKNSNLILDFKRTFGLMVAKSALKATTSIVGATDSHRVYIVETQVSAHKYIKMVPFMKIILSVIKTALFCFFVLIHQTSRTAEDRYFRNLYYLRRYIRNLSPLLQKKVLSYFRFRYKEQFFDFERLRGENQNCQLARLIKNIPVLKELPTAATDALIMSMRVQVFMPGDEIISLHSTYQYLFLLYTGTVAVYTETGQEFEHLEDGSFFGIMSLVDKPSKYKYVLVAIEPTEIYQIRISEFQKIFEAFPYLYQMLLREAEQVWNRYYLFINQSAAFDEEKEMHIDLLLY